MKPLGKVLQQADLISPEQVEIALKEQTQFTGLRLGEILASHGWLKQETADFFSQQWTVLLTQKPKQPLGQYLEKAGLLDECQIKTILAEQPHKNLRFGELAVLKGWLKPTTIQFFLEHLAAASQLQQYIWQYGKAPMHESLLQSEQLQLKMVVSQQNNLKTSNSIEQSILTPKLVEKESSQFRLFSRGTIKIFKLDEKANCPEVVLTEVLFWTDGQPILTQKLCQLLAQSQTLIPAGAEAATVQQLVQNHLINNWKTQEIAEHLQEIQEIVIHNRQCDPLLLLELYKLVWQQGEVAVDNSPEQAELLYIGLVVQQKDLLKLGNRIYQSIFNLNWIEKESSNLKLFSHSTIKLFKLDEKANCPEAVLAEVLFWTDGQSILTQKLCQLIAQSQTLIPAGAEVITVQQLVQNHLINNWKTQEEITEHLQEIQDRIIRNQQCDPLLLLELYKLVWQQGEVAVDNSPEQAELLHIGLVVQQKDLLKLGNRIYQSIFDINWIQQEIDKILYPSMAQTAIYNYSTSPNNLNISHINTLPETRVTKRIWIFLAIASLMLCGSALMVLGFSVFKWLQIELIFKRANELMYQGEYQQAIAKYNNILKIDSNYYQSWTNRGYALARMKDYKQMLQSCTTATLINPEAVYSWNCRGEALYNLKQYNEAIAAFDQAISLNSKDAVFWINKTEALLALKQPDTALNTINQAIELLKKVWENEPKDANAKELAIAFSYQAKVLLQKQDYELALKASEQALKYNPNYFVALRSRGIALQNLKRDDQAIAQFYSIIERPHLSNNQKAEAWYYLGLSLCEFRQTEKAMAAFNQALKLKPDYQAAEQGKKACPKL